MGASKDRNRFVPGLYAVAGIAFGLLVTAGGFWLQRVISPLVSCYIP